MSHDDSDRPHYIVRDLEDELPDLDARSYTPGDDYGDEPREPSYAPGDQTDAQPTPQPDAPSPTRGPRGGGNRRRRDPLANCVTAALPERSRARGIAAVIVVFCDGRKVVMR